MLSRSDVECQEKGAESIKKNASIDRFSPDSYNEGKVQDDKI